MEGIVRELRAVQSRARQVVDALNSIEAQLPEEMSGEDETGVASVQVNRSGEPVGISFSAGWETALADDTLSAAVVEASQAANAARLAALEMAFRSTPLVEPTDDAPVTPWMPADPDVFPTTSLDDLAESALQAMSTIGKAAPSATPSGTGTSARGELTIVLVGGQISDCQIDRNRSRFLSSVAMTMAATEALKLAREAFAASTPPVRRSELDGIFGQAMAHLNEMLRQSTTSGGTGV